MSMPSTAPIIAAAISRTDREIVRALRQANAIRPDRATALPSRGGLFARRLRRLIRAGVVREAGGGLYLDEEALSGYRSEKRVRILVILTAVALLVLVLWLVAR